MGTRAAFWIGDPRKLDSREWLGCKGFDGYPEGFPSLKKIKTARQFRSFVKKLSAESDFAAPSGGWPYPWDKDIFLTDYTYAFFDGKLYVSCYHCGFVTLSKCQRKSFEWGNDDSSCQNIPAPSKYNSKQPDSIIIIH